MIPEHGSQTALFYVLSLRSQLVPPRLVMPLLAPPLPALALLAPSLPVLPLLVPSRLVPSLPVLSLLILSLLACVLPAHCDPRLGTGTQQSGLPTRPLVRLDQTPLRRRCGRAGYRLGRLGHLTKTHSDVRCVRTGYRHGRLGHLAKPHSDARCGRAGCRCDAVAAERATDSVSSTR